MRRYVTALVLGLVLLAGMTVAPREARADAGSSAARTILGSAVALPDILGIDLDDVIKLGGVVYVVREFGDEINSAINTLLNNNDAATGASTKVVVIVTPRGRHIGAAQITGPRAAVRRCNAVVQLEEQFNSFVRVRALVPVEAENATRIQRIKGVAVSAMVDIEL
ncbi:MAG TPA: hypothetical protein VEI97_19190 [bacterium]|nr:hypothetical protein [bacterium]